MKRSALYPSVWRWHFYAGLFVMPMVLVLALTGSLYLFKPQIDRWEERAWRNLPAERSVSPARQVDAALAALPGAKFHSYRLPERDGDAAMVHVALPGPSRSMRDVFVSPGGRVLATLDPESRIMAVTQRIHGQLLLGQRGSWIVELAASWAIAMIASGLYLWWPSGRGLAGSLWPRLSSGRRLFWRDLHAVTGFWVAGLAMILLLTGLPWADVWGSAFKRVRIEMGWVKGRQDWTIGGRPSESGEHASHDHAAHNQSALAARSHVMPDGTVMANAAAPVSLTSIVAEARSEHLPFPVIVTPPGSSPDWSVRSDTANRPLRVTLKYDAMSGRRKAREAFADKHPVDRVIGYGIAWHEGQLFGVLNQLIGVLTALMLVILSVSSFVLWRRRRPKGTLGAPAAPATATRATGIIPIVLTLALLLPMFAASLIVLWLLQALIFRRIPALARWLGLRSAGTS